MATGVLCQNADVEKLNGANASAISKAVGYTDIYINMAEGLICAISRYDYVTNVGSLTTMGVDFLRRASATLAAIYVILYDMSNFTSRIEAEDMLNLHWASWREMRKLLKDQKVVDMFHD